MIEEHNCNLTQEYNLDVSILLDKPIIFRGLVAHWNEINYSDEQNKAYLLDCYSGEPVIAYQVDEPGVGDITYNDDLTGFNFKSRQLGLSELFDNIKKSPDNTYYMGSTLLERWFPGWVEQHRSPLPASIDAMSCIWLGTQTRIAAHFDYPSNLACVVSGKRTFTLFPPEQAKNLYVGPLDFTPAGQPISLVNSDMPDFEKHPLYAEALKHAYKVDLLPGDAIYIPSLWWHQVSSLGSFNILVNYWWRETPKFMGNPLDALKFAVMSINHLPTHEKKSWQALFDTFVFDDNQQLSHIPVTALSCFYKKKPSASQAIKTHLIKQLNR